jgi:hypothetical protein
LDSRFGVFLDRGKINPFSLYRKSARHTSGPEHHDTGFITSDNYYRQYSWIAL